MLILSTTGLCAIH